MNLYLVERTDKVGYDEYDSVVVSHYTLHEAAEMANGLLDSHLSDIKCTLIGTTIYKETPNIIHSSFCAG